MPAYQWEFQAQGSDAASKMATALTRMEKVATTLTPALNTLTASVNALTDGLRPLGDAFTKVAESSTAFRKAIQPLIRYTEKHAEGFRLLSTASATVARSTQDVTVSMRQQASAASSHTTIVNNTTNVINNLGRAMDGARGANKRFHTDFWQSLRNFNTFNAAIQYTRLRISEIGKAMTGVFQKTQQYGGGFESAERQLGVFMGAGQSPAAKKDFEAVVKAAEKTAQETTVGGSDALNAAIAASKAGMQRGDIAKALPTIINASIAEGMDASRIAEIGSITSSQFQRTGLGKGEGGGTLAADVSGSIKILQATAAASSTDINQLFESLKNSASGATMLGMSLDETAATLAVLSQNGETGGRAGTRLMMAFSRMATQTPQATEAMKKLGVTFKDDATGNVKPFTEILDDLKTKLAGVQGNAQKMDYLKKIFGESFSSMAFLVEQGGDAIKKSMQDIKNSMGVGDELQQENMSGMAGAMEAFKGSYEQVYVSLRKVLTVPISNYWLTLANALNAVSSRFSELGKAFDQAKTVDDWMAVLETTDFSDVFSGLADEFAKEIEVLKKLASGIWTLIKSGFQAIWKEIDTEKVMTSVTSSLGKASGALFKSIFTTENMAAATAFGVELGKQILAGLTQSSSGITALFAGVGMLGGDVMRNVAGGLSGLSGMLNGGGQPPASPAAPPSAPRRVGMRPQGNEPARVTFGAQPGNASRFREMTAADTGQKWRVADRPNVNIGKEMVGSFKSALGKGLDGLQVVAANAQMAIATGVFLGNLVNQGVNAYFGGKNTKQDERGLQATRDAILKLNLALGNTTDAAKRADLQARLKTQEAEFEKQAGKSYQQWQAENTTGKQAEQVKRLEEAKAKRAYENRTVEEKYRAAGMTEDQINRALGMGEEYSKTKNKKQWLETTEMFDKETRIKQLQALDPTISPRMAEDQAAQEEKRFRYFQYGREAKALQEQRRAADDRKLDRYAELNTAWNSSDTGKVDFLREQARRQAIQDGRIERDVKIPENAAVMQMGEAQYMRYEKAYAKAKAGEGKNRLKDAEPQTQEEVKAAQARLGIEKEIFNLKKQEAETAAQIANAPIEAQMKNNETENIFQKFMIEPVNAFTQKIGDVISKFTETLSGMGQKKTDIKLKGGLINEEQAKKENIATTQDSIQRGAKLLRIAQGAGQQADAYEAQAGRLAELGQLTGDKSKTQQADEMMRKAIEFRKQDEENQITKIGMDQELAKKNLAELENKKDGSASEAANRFKQLMDSAMELGDVKKAGAYKAKLQEAERSAAGETVKWLQIIANEIKLSRKSNELEIQKEREENKANADKTAQAVSQSASAMPVFDPGLTAPAY